MSNFQYSLYLVLIYLSLGSSCVSTKVHTNASALKDRLEVSFPDHFYGFSLYDLEDETFLLNHNGDKLFTPASNIKILTLYTALETLPDSIPTIKYLVRQDTVYIWGMGDPTTLHPAFEYQDNLTDFLKKFDITVLCTGHFQEKRFGPGWAWDDYLYGYQMEKSPLPLFGNKITVSYDSTTRTVQYYPNIFSLQYFEKEKFGIRRGEYDNNYSLDIPDKSSFNISLPIFNADTLTDSILSQLTMTQVRPRHTCPDPTLATTLFSSSADTAYRHYMHHSDNFTAEQLLLSASGYKFDTLSSRKIISDVKNSLPERISEGLHWYDGSGLSRYNKCKPESIIYLLNKIYNRIGMEGVKAIFAVGGQTGTIKSWYANPDGPPFIFAKTGTLRGVHCLSGYLITDDGKALTFSFMHNHFAGSSTPIKKKMEQILLYIKSNYQKL